METTKSELELMLELTASLLVDIANKTGCTTKRDELKIRHRVASEGPSFLTKTLPALGKALDRALSSSTPMDYRSFRVDRFGYPRFLGGLFQKVFDPQGMTLADACPCLVSHIRQVLYLWYKYELPYTQAQEDTLEEGFLATDAALPEEMPECPVLQGARDLVSRVLADFSYQAIVPRHGPGAVATRERGWEKWAFKRLYLPIERFFPFSEWYIPSLSYLARHKDPLGYLSVHGSGTARAVFVPKDSRGPRLISCEPLEYQWIQQGIAAEIVYCINRHSFTSGRVNFTNQMVNRRYAKDGSAGAGWVTLDMKDASDRVSTALVHKIFGGTHILDYLLCSRTSSTVLPSGREVILKKFAPMGSALCFPVESLIFFALAVNVLVYHNGVPLDKAVQSIKVYGDDIICGREDYAAIMQYFPYVGLKFNEAKCCTGGSFRESCGMDAYKGRSVTPVKIRTRLSDRRDAAAIASAIEYSNMLYSEGYVAAAGVLEGYVKNRLGRDAHLVPTLGDADYLPVPYLAFRRAGASSDPQYDPTDYLNRWNDKLHRVERRRLCIRGLVVKRDIPGWERLFANLASMPPRSAQPYRNQDPDYYTSEEESKYGVPVDTIGLRSIMFPLRRRVTLIRRWCA